MTFTNISQVKTTIRKAVEFYNAERPHSSLDWLTPNEAHKKSGELKKHWKSHRENAIKKMKNIFKICLQSCKNAIISGEFVVVGRIVLWTDNNKLEIF